MKKQIIISGTVVAVLFILFFAYFSSRLASRGRELTSSFESGLGIALSYRSADTSLFPRPHLVLREVRLSVPENTRGGPGAKGGRALARRAASSGSPGSGLQLLEAAELLIDFPEASWFGFLSASARVVFDGTSVALSSRSLPRWRKLLEDFSASGPGKGLSELRINVEESVVDADDAWFPVSFDKLGNYEFSARALSGGDPGFSFEVSGALFGGQGQASVEGKVVWGVGPGGGHSLTAAYAFDDVEVERLRAVFPGKVHNTLSGTFDLRGKLDGIVGETGTELVPATPLRGDFAGGLDWTLLGRSKQLSFSGDFALDDVRARLLDGHVSWGDLDAEAAGWMSLDYDPRFSLRLLFDDVDVAAAAEDFGVAEAWRPIASFIGELRAEGSFSEPGYRYQGKAPVLRLPALEGYDVEARDAEFKGVLAAINTNASLSLSSPELRIGEFKLPDSVVGINYFRRRLTISSFGRKLWGGKLDLGGYWEPDQPRNWQFAGRLSAQSAATVVERLLPSFGFRIRGRAGGMFKYLNQGGKGELMGRSQLQRAVWSGPNLSEDLIAGLSRATRRDLLTDSLTGAFPKTFAPGATEIRRLNFDYKADGDGFIIGAVGAAIGELRLRAQGRLEADKSLLLQGGVEVSKLLSAELAARLPWLRSLFGEDGRLDLPVVIGGRAAEPKLSLSNAALELLAAAEAGKSPRVYELGYYPAIEMDLPELSGSGLF